MEIVWSFGVFQFDLATVKKSVNRRNGWRLSYLSRQRDRPESCVNGPDKLTEKQLIDVPQRGFMTTVLGWFLLCCCTISSSIIRF